MSKTTVWIGRIISWLVGLFVLTSGINVMFIRSADVVAGFKTFGYPENVMVFIGAAAFISSALYLIPRTRFIGAILMTAYLGGAVATHVRINDPTFVVAVIVGILVWLGLFLRDTRIRGLVLG